jgi:hypothetical protein
MPPADRTAWERLGRLLTERRTQISPRYANRRAFAADREMNWRTLHDIEQAKRDNFKPETMRAFETAYMLAPGSLDRVLAGGDLEPAPDPRPAPLRAVPPSRASGPVAIGILFGMLDRHPDDDDLAAEILAAIVPLVPDDDTLAAIVEVGLRRGRTPVDVAGEVREWLTYLDRADGNPENGASAGLPGNAGRLKEW